MTTKLNELYKIISELNSINNTLNEQMELINDSLEKNVNYLEEIQSKYGDIMFNLTIQYHKNKDKYIDKYKDIKLVI
jgi:hypothetical protein